MMSGWTRKLALAVVCSALVCFGAAQAETSGNNCLHNYNTEGYCVLCGFQCVHPGIQTIVDSVEFVGYEKGLDGALSTVKHLTLKNQTQHEYCPVCGYTGEQTTVIIEELEPHEDADMNGFCDQCLYDIQQSDDWEAHDGILTIKMHGELPDYSSGKDTPWAIYRDAIRLIIIDQNITYIGEYAFAGFTAPGLRVEFNQCSEPEISDYAFLGTSNAVCRYYVDGNWTEDDYGGTNISWIYLPVKTEDGTDGEVRRLEYTNQGWAVSVFNNQTMESELYYMTVDQIKETTYGKMKDLVFHAIPMAEVDRSVYSDWDSVSGIHLGPECVGTLNVALSTNAILNTVEIRSASSVLNMTDPRESGLKKMICCGGRVTCTGNIQTLILEDAGSTENTITVTGDVTTLYFNDSTTQLPYNGTFTLTGTIDRGIVRGGIPLEIPGAGTYMFPERDVSTFENLGRNNEALIVSGVLQGKYERLEITLEMFAIQYSFFHWNNGTKANLQMIPKEAYVPLVGEEQIAYTDLDIQPEQIFWGDDTTVSFQTTAEDGVFSLNGKKEDGKWIGLGRVDILYGQVEVNCPTEIVNIQNAVDAVEGVELIINNRVGYLSMTDLNSGFVTLETDGSVEYGNWFRRNRGMRIFGPVTGACAIYDEGCLQVMSRKEGHQVWVKIPSDSTVSLAAGVEGEAWAVADVEDVSIEVLGETENEKLSSFLTARRTDELETVFDATVTMYSKDENGNVVEGMKIHNLNQKLPFAISNNSGRICYVVRLHEEGGSVTVKQVTMPTADPVITFESDLLGKYVVIKTDHLMDPDKMKTMYLPGMLTEIGENAFEGGVFEAVVIPDGCAYIEHEAFKDCENLIYVSCPAEIMIEEDAFEGCDILKWEKRN